MTEISSSQLPRRQWVSMIPTLGVVAVLWIFSSWGYYALADRLELDSGYNDAPFVFAGYYLGWALLTLFLFRATLTQRLSQAVLSGHVMILAPMLICFGTFVAFVLPLFPNVSVIRAPEDPPEFMFATAWYYLPKSADILFQQAIVATLIHRAAQLGLGLRAISIAMAIMFGGFHLALALDGFTATYVIRFSIAATAFGLVLPYLYLRIQHGFRWAYGIHWSFYILDAVITHLVLAAPPWAQS